MYLLRNSTSAKSGYGTGHFKFFIFIFPNSRKSHTLNNLQIIPGIPGDCQTITVQSTI